MSLSVDSNERQPGRTARAWVPIVQGIAVVFYGDIRDRQLRGRAKCCVKSPVAYRTQDAAEILLHS